MAQADVYALGVSLAKIVGCDGLLSTALYNAQTRLSPPALHLLSCMVAPEGVERWTAGQLTGHPYLSG